MHSKSISPLQWYSLFPLCSMNFRMYHWHTIIYHCTIYHYMPIYCPYYLCVYIPSDHPTVTTCHSISMFFHYPSMIYQFSVPDLLLLLPLAAPSQASAPTEEIPLAPDQQVQSHWSHCAGDFLRGTHGMPRWNHTTQLGFVDVQLPLQNIYSWYWCMVLWRQFSPSYNEFYQN